MTSRDDEMVGRKGGRTDASGFASATSHANTPLSPHPARRAFCWVSASRLLAIRAAARGIVLTDVEEARAGDGEQVGRGPAGPERVRARVEEGLAVEQGAHDLLEQVLVGRARAVLDRERVVRVDGLEAAAARGRGVERRYVSGRESAPVRCCGHVGDESSSPAHSLEEGERRRVEVGSVERVSLGLAKDGKARRGDRRT